MIVEPMAGERVEDNLNPLGRALSGASTMLCTPHSRATGGPALGALASEARLREVVTAGGFGTVPASHRDAVQSGLRGSKVGAWPASTVALHAPRAESMGRLQPEQSVDRFGGRPW